MTSTMELGKLVVYNEEHGVLICRECKYGIQKNAIGSHLLRHKIYRGERQNLLTSIATLRLPDPDDVHLPAPGLPPIEHLSLISGYACTADGCGNLCASEKRMRRHWAESHDADFSDSAFRVALLQTFFRGTKLRYFEVVAAGNVMALGGAQKATSTSTMAPTMSLSEISRSRLDSKRFDMNTLRYFHHFMAVTCDSLPPGADQSKEYWQTTIVAQALKVQWLMCGLLAIAAKHLFSLAADDEAKLEHQEYQAACLQEFLSTWNQIKDTYDAERLDELGAGAQIFSIICCTHWASRTTETYLPLVQLHTVGATIRACADVDFALRNTFQEHPVPGAASYQRAFSAGDKSPPGLVLDRLRSLPFRMTEVFGRPDNAGDVIVVLAVVNSLVECYHRSYGHEDAATSWAAMEAWLGRVPDRFNQMLAEENAASLVVLAHWAVLVERAEYHYWFLHGMAVRIVDYIKAQLPSDRMRGLVNGLVQGQDGDKT